MILTAPPVAPALPSASAPTESPPAPYFTSPAFYDAGELVMAFRFMRRDYARAICRTAQLPNPERIERLRERLEAYSEAMADALAEAATDAEVLLKDMRSRGVWR